jgi:hypothetical protein
MIWRAPIFEAPYWDDKFYNPAPTPIACEPENATVDTGILDAAGNKILRDARRPIGFLTK